MSLLETMRGLRVARGPSRADTARFKSAVQSIQDAFPTDARASALSIDAAAVKVSHAVARWDWEGVSVGTVSLVCRGYLQGRQFDGVVKAFVQRELEATTSGRILEAVAEAYLSEWESRGQRTAWMAGLLQARSRHLPHRWKQLFLALPELLEPEHAPTEVASRMLPFAKPYIWLESLGLPSPHSGRLMAHVHHAYLTALPPPRSLDDVERIFAWIRPSGRPPIADDLAATAIRKLLDPWISTTPGSDLRQRLLETITNAYGDPRQGKYEFWKLMPQTHVRVVVRWLAGQSMDALFRVITEATQSDMWASRHDFWKGLYDRGLVDEAWVVLSPEAFLKASRLAADTGDTIYTMAARQTSKRREDTCMLIMRVGHHTVVEGSHDYRVHLFRDGDPRAPTLYQPVYNADDITLPQNDPMTRIHDTSGRWTEWVRDRVLK